MKAHWEMRNKAIKYHFKIYINHGEAIAIE